MFLWIGCLLRSVKPQASPKAEQPPCDQGRTGVCVILKFSKRPPGKHSKPGIHPAYNELNVICACGHVFKTRSTHKGDIRVEICSSWHPFFTRRQKLVYTAGRIDKFERK